MEMAIAMFLNGDSIWEPDARGQRIVDDSFLLLFNAGPDQVLFTVPELTSGPPESRPWKMVLDTTLGTGIPERSIRVITGNQVPLESRSLRVL